MSSTYFSKNKLFESLQEIDKRRILSEKAARDRAREAAIASIPAGEFAALLDEYKTADADG